ncbi:hypothetical protein ABEV74_04125 [Paenibacillus cisolokensis]|uniref:hypothetical protein n=1 Tax=Paenibacillus cisolokensis TaxID=1658519 RepID=UPI003D278377
MDTRHVAAAAPKSTSGAKLARTAKFVFRNRALYIMLIPGMLYFLVFKYFPLLGSVIAFQDYNIFKGFWNSEWVGFKWFGQFLSYPNLNRLLTNTLIAIIWTL